MNNEHSRLFKGTVRIISSDSAAKMAMAYNGALETLI